MNNAETIPNEDVGIVVVTLWALVFAVFFIVISATINV